MTKNFRQSFIERLDLRYCLASVWQNSALPLDVDASGLVSAADALQVINRLNRFQGSDLPNDRPEGQPFCDTNGDGSVSALDALLVINALNRHSDPLSLAINLARGHDRNGNGVVLSDAVEFVGSTLAGVRVDVLVDLSLSDQSVSTLSETGTLSTKYRRTAVSFSWAVNVRRDRVIVWPSFGP